VIDPIEEFLQIKINTPAVACRDTLLRLCHRLMSRSSRSEPAAPYATNALPCKTNPSKKKSHSVRLYHSIDDNTSL
jgi:hypothetical protein